MTPQKIGKQFSAILKLAGDLANVSDADALLVLLDRPTDWEKLKQSAANQKVLLATDSEEVSEGAGEFGIAGVVLDMPDAPVYERLAQALLEFVADELLNSGDKVIAVYNGFEAGKIDSISVVKMHEHLGRLTSRDLQQLETKVPLDTLKSVVDLAVEIGREGREGKPVGTIFVVGDHRKTTTQSHPAGYDPVRGYNRSERNLQDRRNREAVKEVAQLDGAFIVSADGTVESSCQLIDTPPVELTLSKGLGARHWAAAAISKTTKAIAVAVSESNGTVRIFQNGEVVLRIEPMRRAMKWRDFDIEPPAQD